MCERDADQLEAWGRLENRSAASLVRLDAAPVSSAMREKSLLRLVTLPRSLGSESTDALWLRARSRLRAARRGRSGNSLSWQRSSTVKSPSLTWEFFLLTGKKKNDVMFAAYSDAFSGVIVNF